MTKHLALQVLLGLGIIGLVLGQSTTCNTDTEFLYQGGCVPKACLNTKVSRMQLSIADPIVAFKGTLTQGIAYSAYKVDNGYEVQIRYKDIEDNQLVSDPNKCLDWRLYQTANEMSVNPSRLWGQTAASNYAGDKPTWPVATYKFVKPSQEAQITFNFSLKDMETRQCLKLKSSTSIQYQCFFELTFVLRGVSQVSYYYCVQIRLDTALNTQTAQVQFVPIIQQVGCPVAESVCTVQVKVKSTLSFCENETCQNTKDSPFGVLYLNRVFHMKHEINDIDFQSWLILDIQVTMQALGFQLVLSSTEFDVIQQVAGYNIIRLKVPIVAANVVISVQGKLKESIRMLGERMLAGNPTETGVGAQIDLGEVTAQPVDTANENSSSQSSSNAALLLTGTTLLFGLID